MMKRFALLSTGVFLSVLTGNVAASFALCQACGGCQPGVSACADELGELNCAPLCTNSTLNVNANCADWNCPPTEVGQCDDGMNNDAWVDDLTDAEDPDCQAAAAPASVPALSLPGVTAALLLLIGLGVYGLRRRTAA